MTRGHRRPRASTAPSGSPTTSTTRSPGSSAGRPTTSSWRCTRSCGPSTAPTSRAASTSAGSRPRRPTCWSGPGEGAGVVDVGDGIGAALRIESHNHPQRHRALPGRRHRRRRHPARHLLDGRPAHRHHGPAAVRPARRRPQPLDRRGRGVGRLRLRQLRRRAHRRRRGGLRRDLRREPARQRAVPRRCCPSSAWCWPGRRASATSPCCSARAPAATASAGRRCWRRPASARARTTQAKRPSVQVGDPFEEKRLIEACLELLDRRLAVGVQDLGAAGITGATSRDRQQGRLGHRRAPVGGPPARAGHGALRGDDLRVPGADARHRRARAPRRGAGHRRQVGDPGLGHRRGQLARAASACSTASAARCSPTSRRRRSTPTPRCTTGRSPSRPTSPAAGPATSPPSCCVRRGRRPRRRPAPRCWPTRRGCTPSTTTSSSSTPSRRPAATPRCCG